MTELLVVENLRKNYGRFTALNDVDLALPAGRMTAIIGPNGAGKTTLINVLTGLSPADDGRVLLDGHNITDLPAHKRVGAGISRSFQITSFFPRLTVAENVLVPVLAYRGMAGRSWSDLEEYGDAWEEVDRLLDAVGLAAERDQAADALAHGSQRLLEIAMALAPHPRLCFLDEPMAGTNPAERRQILDLIARLADNRTTTFVLVEHDMDVVFSVADWIVVMNRGEILTAGVPQDIRDHTAVREVYLGEEMAV
jgi:branched-chain amino acid transport system ATP-binding protein